MHTVLWTYKLPAGTSKDQLVETIKATARNYEGIPGLSRKYYGIASDGSSLAGVYLWENVTAANAFHTADWVGHGSHVLGGNAATVGAKVAA